MCSHKLLKVCLQQSYGVQVKKDPANVKEGESALYSKGSLHNIGDSLQRCFQWHAEDTVLATGKIIPVPDIMRGLQFLGFQRAISSSMIE